MGLLRNSRDETINLQDYAFAKRDRAVTVPVIGVAGTALNSGKTTAAASLGFGLGRLGYRVAALKITGAGAFDDVDDVIIMEIGDGLFQQQIEKLLKSAYRASVGEALNKSIRDLSRRLVPVAALPPRPLVPNAALPPTSL